MTTYAVDNFCFSDITSATDYECAHWPITTTINNNVLTTVSCDGQSGQGILQLYYYSKDLGTGTVTASGTRNVTIYFDNNCVVQDDSVAAYEQIFGAVLAAICICWGAWQLYKMLYRPVRGGE